MEEKKKKKWPNVAVFMVLHQAKGRKGSRVSREPRVRLVSFKSQTVGEVGLVLIARSWGGESFTFISEPPFVRAQIRGEKQEGGAR